LADLLATVDATPHLDWLLLTKRPELAEQRLKSVGVWQSWPRPNVWLGVSTENQKRADERIPILIDLPAHVHFLSCEPLLGPIDLQLNHIEWIIAGRKSGPRHRPMHPDWARACGISASLASPSSSNSGEARELAAGSWTDVSGWNYQSFDWRGNGNEHGSNRSFR